jgi:hypothetical protein
MKKILYVGSSWASRSFDTPDGSEKDYTNLASELNLPVVNLSKLGISNMEILDIIKNYKKEYDAVIWVFTEPLTDPTWDATKMKDFFESENFWEMRLELMQNSFKYIASIGCPVALISGSSDIINCNHDNITVIHTSWQKFLAKSVNVDLQHGWGVDTAHRMLMMDAQDIVPSMAVLDLVSDTFKSWHQLELKRVFNWCHPNKNGNKLFATEIAQSLNAWIDKINQI